MPSRRKPVRGGQVLKTFQSHEAEWFYPSAFCHERMLYPGASRTVRTCLFFLNYPASGTLLEQHTLSQGSITAFLGYLLCQKKSSKYQPLPASTCSHALLISHLTGYRCPLCQALRQPLQMALWQFCQGGRHYTLRNRVVQCTRPFCFEVEDRN